MTDELIGRRFGGYEILDVIGRGGMATVYRAAQTTLRSRIVALKILPRQFMHDETYIMRFKREVEIVAALEHRNIVPVYDHGDYEGQPYIVMRYMSGGSVDDLLDHGAIPPPRVLSILEQIAPALDYAHGRGVLHRDIKPSNVLMDDDGGAYLTDFGIARIMSDASGGTTTTQGVVGTPSYMSPEQAQGQPLDGRSDVYSLGVMLFEMVTGRRPFESDTPYGVAVLHVTAPPPTPRSVNPVVASAVEDVILAAMRKRREDRFQDGAALVSAFRRAARSSGSIRDTAPEELPRASGIDVPLDDAPTAPTPAPPIPNSPVVGAGYIPTVAPRATPSPAPVRQAAPAASIPPVPPTYTPPPTPMYAAPAPMPARRPRRTIGGVWIGALVGGLLGCGLLSAILIAVVLVILQTSQEESGIRAATQTVQSLATLETAAPTAVTRRRTRTPNAPSTPTPLPGIPTNAPIGARESGLSGRIVYAAERDNSGRALALGEPGDFNLYWLDLATGAETRMTGTAYAEIAPAVSPDGQAIAFIADRGSDFDLYVMNVRTLAVRRLTDNAVADRAPAWSADGAFVVYSSDTASDGSYDLYRIDVNGNNAELLYDAAPGQRASDAVFTPDGRYMLFTLGSARDAASWEIMRLELATGDVTALTQNTHKDWRPAPTSGGDVLFLTERAGGEIARGYAAVARIGIDGGDVEIVYDGDGYESSAQFSPDETLLIFTSDVSGRDEVYARVLDGASDPVQVTTEGGFGAVWLAE